MRIWLDDVRPKPDEYDIWVKTSEEAILYLASESVTEISLDYDLANGDCGINVLEFIEKFEHVSETTKFINVYISIHSQNPEGVRRMNLVLDSIIRNRKKLLKREWLNYYDL